MITIPESFTLYIDIAVIVLYCIAFVVGYRKGFFVQIISTVGTILCFALAWRYSSVGAQFFRIFPKSLAPLQDTVMKDAIYAYANEIAWFIVLFIVFRLILFIFEKFISGLRKIPVIKQASGLLGGILGIIVMTVWMLVFSIILNTSFFKNGREIKEKTYLNLITKSVSTAVEKFGIPVNSTEAFNKLYTGAQDLSDDDKQAIKSWLEARGYETIEDMEKEKQDETKPTSSPSASPDTKEVKPSESPSTSIEPKTEEKEEKDDESGN